MSVTANDVEKWFSGLREHPDVAQAWASADADVRFVISDPDVELTVGRDAELTDREPTHELRIAWGDLEQIISGRRSFLRSVTGRRLMITGPVMTSFAVGQALTAFSALPR